MTERAEAFTPKHHALMMAWIAQAVVDAVGDREGERIVRKAVARYGHQRGRRMAMRAEADGQPLTVESYLAYAEVKPRKGDTQTKLLERSPDARSQVIGCAWYDAWNENDLMPYGRYFCMEIDRAVVRGFNPQLVLEVGATMPSGADCCDFVFRDADLTIPRLAGILWTRAVGPARRAAMPWEYHVGHLFKSFGEVVAEELGDAAEDVMASALGRFADSFGMPARVTLLAYQSTNFDELP